MPPLERIAAGDLGGTPQYQPLMKLAQIAAAVETTSSNFAETIAVFPIIKVLALIIFVPVLLILIFRTERFFAMLEYQLHEANKSFIPIDAFKPQKSNK